MRRALSARLSKSHRARTAEVVTSVATVEIAVAINGTIVEIAVAINGTIVEDVMVAEVVMVAEDIRVVASAMSVETTAAAEIKAIAVAIGPAPNARILTSPSAPNAIVVMRRSPKERVIEVTVVEVTVVTAVTVEKIVAVNVATVGDTEATAAVETEAAARREETTAVATGIVRNAIIRISPSARSAIAVMRRSPKAEVAEATEVTDEAAAVEVTTEVETAAAVIVVDFSLAVIAQDHLEAGPPVVGIVLVAVGSAAATKAKTSVELRACTTASTPEIPDFPMRAFISARHEGHSWRRARRCCGSTRSNSIRRAISRKRSNSPVRSSRLIRDIQMRG
jgi:hypothetical protein